MSRIGQPGWLPEGKTAAVCFSIDDVHPGRATDPYEAGGELGNGVLKHVLWLLERHPALHVTLFVAADWRQLSPFLSHRLLAKIPRVRDHIFLTPVRAKGTMRLDRHQHFVRFLKELPRTHVGLHGLYHVHTGLAPSIEFQNESVEECTRVLQEAMRVFRAADIEFVPGLCPPAWNAPPNLTKAMAALGLRFVASARDVRTPIARDATTQMSGMKDMSLLYPQLIEDGRLVHLTSNFSANNPIDRAFHIVEANGLLAVKAHIIKSGFGHVAVDGLDELFRNYLDAVFSELERRYGDALWWTSFDEVSQRVLRLS